MSNYPLFRYITGDSKVHMMNSKLKILWFLFTLSLICFCKDYISLLVIFATLIYLMAKSDIRFGLYISNLLVIWPIYIFLVIFVLLISFDAFLSIFICLKVILAFLLFILLTFTTSLSEIAWGFENLFARFKKVKVPVTKISLRIAFGIKFISTLFERTKEIRKSMAYRGIPYKSGTMLSFKKMFLPVLKVSYKLSRRTIKAMRLRFYGYSNSRTNYHENKVTKFDKVLIVIDMIILYFVIYFGWII